MNADQKKVLDDLECLPARKAREVIIQWFMSKPYPLEQLSIVADVINSLEGQQEE